MCFVLRRWTTWWPAAFVGGLLYGFSAYMAYYDGNYLFLIFVPLPPVIFLLLHEILVRQQWRPGRTGALLGVVCALQFFIWSEVLASTVVMGAVAVVLFLLVSRHQLAERWRYAVTAFAYSLGVGGLLLLFPVIYALAGPQSIRGTPCISGHDALLPSDLFGAIRTELPMARHEAADGDGKPTVRVRDGSLSGASPGGRSRVVRGLSPQTKDDSLRGDSGADRLCPVPGSPSLGRRSRNVNPSSFRGVRAPPRCRGLYPGPVLALHRTVRGGDVRHRARRALATDEAIGSSRMVVPEMEECRHGGSVGRTQRPPRCSRWHHVTRSRRPRRMFRPSSRRQPLRPFQPGAWSLPIPTRTPQVACTSRAHDIMLDQAVAGMRFKLIGGYGWFPSPTGTHGTTSPSVLKPESVQAIFDAAFHGNATTQMAPLSKSNVTALRVFLRKYDVQTVVVSPSGADPAAVVSYVTAAIGSPVESGGVTAWFHVKERLRGEPGPRRPRGGWQR